VTRETVSSPARRSPSIGRRAGAPALLLLVGACGAGARDAGVPAEGLALERELCALVSEERMQAVVRELVALGPRMGGTASGAAAAEYARRAFERAGLPVEVVEDAPVWCHAEGGWRVAAGAPGDSARELERAWPWGFSPGTSGTAPLALTDGDGVAWLSADPPPRPLDGVRADVLLTDALVTAEGDWPKLRALAAGPDNPLAVFGIGRAEGDDLRRRLRAGEELRVSWSLDARIVRAPPRTVVARLAGPPDGEPGHFLLCAHGDSDAGGPGANDNASGVAIVLEIARAWSTAVRDGSLAVPGREVRFAVWGTEIHSSRAYLERALERGERILGVVNFDQSGFGSSADRLFIEPDDLAANAALVREATRVLDGHAGTAGLPARFATNGSQGGTDSYVFSDSAELRARGVPSVTVYASAWDRPREVARTPGMRGESWRDRDRVAIDYDVYYHSAGDLPGNTTDREPWNMGWCARLGLLVALRATEPGPPRPTSPRR